MSLIRVEQVGSNTLERAEKLLAGIPDGMDRAVKSAMSRAASHLRTNSSKEIRKVYAISAGALRSEQNIKTKYTYHPGEDVSAQVLFSGCKIPLYRYNGTGQVSPGHSSNPRALATHVPWCQCSGPPAGKHLARTV